MTIYFEDGELRHVNLIPVEVDFKVCASLGVSRNIEIFDFLNEKVQDAIVYTNSIFALHNMYAWNEELKAPEIYIRAGENGVFTRIDKLTNRELRQAHNLAKMYVSGEFDNGIKGKLNHIKE